MMMIFVQRAALDKTNTLPRTATANGRLRSERLSRLSPTLLTAAVFPGGLRLLVVLVAAGQRLSGHEGQQVDQVAGDVRVGDTVSRLQRGLPRQPLVQRHQRAAGRGAAGRGC